MRKKNTMDKMIRSNSRFKTVELENSTIYYNKLLEELQICIRPEKKKNKKLFRTFFKTKYIKKESEDVKKLKILSKSLAVDQIKKSTERKGCLRLKNNKEQYKNYKENARIKSVTFIIPLQKKKKNNISSANLKYKSTVNQMSKEQQNFKKIWNSKLSLKDLDDNKNIIKENKVDNLSNKFIINNFYYNDKEQNKDDLQINKEISYKGNQNSLLMKHKKNKLFCCSCLPFC